MKKSKSSSKPDLTTLSSDPLIASSTPSIYPRPKGLILNSSNILSQYGRNHLHALKKKRTYYQTLSFVSQSSIWRTQARKLSLDTRLLKYTRVLNIQYFGHVVDRYIIHCWQKMTQVNKIHIDIFDTVSLLSRASKQATLQLFKSLSKDTTSMIIKFRCQHMLADETILVLLEQLTCFLRTLTNLTELDIQTTDMTKTGPLQRFQTIEYPIKDEESSIQKMQNRVSRLTKIEKLGFKNRNSGYYSCFNIFFHNLDHLKNLQHLEICNIPTEQLKSVISKLKQTQSLSSIIFYQQIEPQDALHIASSIRSLEKLAIREDWHFYDMAMPILQTLRPKDINVTSLHLDFPLNIGSKEDVDFILSFFSPFQKLQSLYLYLRSDLKDETLFSGLNNILKNNPLQELVFGLGLCSGQQVSQALEQMIGITTLKRLSLTIKLHKAKEWKTGLKFVCPSIAKLLHDNKDLKDFEIFIEKVSSKFLEQLRELFKAICGLNSLKCAYSPLYKWNRRVHATILQELEQTFTEYIASEKITIQLSYLPAHGESCEEWSDHLVSKVRMGERVKKCIFKIKRRIEVPFCNEYLACE